MLLLGITIPIMCCIFNAIYQVALWEHLQHVFDQSVLIDIISIGIYPAVLLLSYGNFNSYFLPSGFAILAVGVLRFCYLNIF